MKYTTGERGGNNGGQNGPKRRVWVISKFFLAFSHVLIIPTIIFRFY